MSKTKVIAFYLPQFHPFPENDTWWGKGFTEWTNVGKAKKLFPGHYQPRVPADLGYYDLRLSEVREQQVELAKEAGITAFCYYEYWFAGKQLMEKPFEEVVSSGKPDFPFCVCWANHSWSNKNWNSAAQRLEKKLLIEQTYPGVEDIDNHFYSLLPAFKDSRYLRINDKLVFVIYDYKAIPDRRLFTDRWNELAKKNGIPPFFFIGYSASPKEIHKDYYSELNAVILSNINGAFGNPYSLRRIARDLLLNKLLRLPAHIVSYKKGIKRMMCPEFKLEHIFPSVAPNWDHSPRLGKGGTILHNSTPMLFKEHVSDVLELVRKKKEENQVIFIKSWNEWAEGNHMEPDLKYGKGYIKALREALNRT